MFATTYLKKKLYCFFQWVVWITCGLWCFYLFGLSFWRHPFTAEDPLVSKWCNANFLQNVLIRKQTSTSWTDWVNSQKIYIFGWTIPLVWLILFSDEWEGAVPGSEKWMSSRIVSSRCSRIFSGPPDITVYLSSKPRHSKCSLFK